MASRHGKRGQVTIFIILGILIVASIITLFLLFGQNIISGPVTTEETASFIEKCTKDAVLNATERVIAGGGKMNPELYIKYRDDKYNYLCYQMNFFYGCVMQQPMLKHSVEDELENATQNAVESCFAELRDDLEAKGYSVQEGALNYSIELAPASILLHINKKVDISKGDNAQSFTKFDSRVLSPLNELVFVAREIASEESQFCNFEYNGFMIFYPEYNIKKIDYMESKIYQVTKDGSTFKFAVRSCAMPPGL